MGYVIKLTHRYGGKAMYVAAVPVATDHEDYGLVAVDFTNTAFDDFEEASKFPYPTAEVAADVVFSFPKTENAEYEVVPISESQLSEEVMKTSPSGN